MLIKMRSFTLAEVLVVLTIIGIVASMTIPSIMTKTQEQEFKVGWKKYFAEISQAYNLIKMEHGGDLSEYFGTSFYQSTPLQIEFAKHLSVMKNCAADNSGIICQDNKKSFGSYNAYYKTLSGDKIDYNNFLDGNMILNNGALVIFRSYERNFMLMWVDVNGYYKGPNTAGKDLFGMVVSKNNILPMGAPRTGAQGTCVSTPVTCDYYYGWQYGSSCAGAGCSAEYLYK